MIREPLVDVEYRTSQNDDDIPYRRCGIHLWTTALRFVNRGEVSEIGSIPPISNLPQQ